MPTATTTLRVSTQTQQQLRQLAEEAGVSMQTIVVEALELYRRKQLLDKAHAAYTRVKADPKAWANLSKEREDWDTTLADGLTEY